MGLVAVGPDQGPQIPHGLLKLGVCLENHRELADPLPTPGRWGKRGRERESRKEKEKDIEGEE